MSKSDYSKEDLLAQLNQMERKSTDKGMVHSSMKDMGEVESGAEGVVAKLIERGWTISFAESCTGGMVAARLVSVPDASKVFAASVVTYANEAKVKYVDVNPQTIEKYGVVSEEVALEMAKGVAKANGAQVGVGISGIAGPTGGTATKPIGMVCFGFVIGEENFSRTCYFGNIGRDVVRRASTNYVYTVLGEWLGA